MLVKVQKWGNSLALRIPKSFAQEVSLVSGTEATLSIVDGRLIVEPLRQGVYVLEHLLTELKDEQIHAEQGYGHSVGKEVW